MKALSEKPRQRSYLFQKPNESIMGRFDFDKQLFMFSAVVYNRDRVIWLS